MHGEKQKLILGRNEIEQLEFQSSFTLACRKSLKRSYLRRWMAKTLSSIGVKNVTIVYATDIVNGGEKGNLPIAWHIAFDKKLTLDQMLEFNQKVEELRKSRDLGSEKYFFKWGIQHTAIYMLEHPYFDIQKMSAQE